MKLSHRTDKQKGRTGLMVCASLAMILILILLVPAANANSLTVDSTRVTLSSKQQVFALRVHNNTDRPMTLQLKAQRWQQQDGDDIYADTRDLLLLPPLFTIGAQQSDTVRIGLRKVPDEHTELSYQLYLHELASSQSADSTLNTVNVPVFIEPASGSAMHELEWVTTLTVEGERVLSVVNHGNGHAKITKLQGIHPEHALNQSINNYVLPGARLSWVVSREYETAGVTPDKQDYKRLDTVEEAATHSSTAH